MSTPTSTSTTVTPKPRPYRRYLTSTLHTRFVHAVLLALFNAFIITFWTGKDYFWSWFPFGSAGLKAALFTMSSLFVFVLQLATLNVGRYTSASAPTTFRRVLLDSSTYQTVFWYIVSAWWFCEAYIWAVPESYNMGWVIRGVLNSPDRLNERPIYLRFFFTVLGIVQSGVHLYFGQSFLHIPVGKPSTTQTGEQQIHPIDSIQKQLQRTIPTAAFRAIIASGVATITAPFIYKPFFRDFFWKLHLSFAKPFFNLSRADANPPNTYFIGTILGWAFIVGAGLSFTWAMSAQSFLIYLKQAPLKAGLPLSAGSKDPNGTLLNGLAAKRSIVRVFAFWELSLIAQKYPDRRKAIFADFERLSGPMWTSMMRLVLSAIADIDSRLLALDPSPPKPAQSQASSQVDTLPRIVANPSNNPIFAALPPASTTTQKVRDFLAATNKAIGQSQHPWSPPLKETQQKLLEYAKPAVGPGGNDLQTSVTTAFKKSPIGGFFSVDIAKKMSSAILGSPAGNAAIIVDAIEAITKMLVASLNEDDFGKAVQTVPESVKQFTRTIMMIEGYVKANGQSLTSGGEKELEEVVIVVDRLKKGLRELLAAFQVFLNDAGLSIKDLNEARKASEERPLIPTRQVAGSTNSRMPEMQQPSRRQVRQPGAGDVEHNQDDARELRTKETAQSLRRIGSQPTRQRVSGGERNVFGARDLGSGVNRWNGRVGIVQ